jgi:beta-amylase
MLQLDWMSDDGMSLRNEASLRRQLTKLKATGVRGVMADVWWGLCEPSPRQYRFGAAKALCDLLRSVGLELQAVMSFHQCGGNVGDAVTVQLPSFVLGPAREQGLLYQSRSGVVSEDCLSLSADDEAIFDNGAGSKRTALHCYRDFIAAFASACGDHLGSTVSEIQVGMGPCGELRYPSYMLSKGWEYPGVGLVMAYDKGMTKMLQRSTRMKAPPTGLPEDQNAGPDACGFFRAAPTHSLPGQATEIFASTDGKAFLEWHTKVLIDHGAAVLREATAALKAVGPVDPDKLCFSVKVSGIHWYCMHPSRAAEACAGYNNVRGSDAYADIARMLSDASAQAGRPVLFNFTCLEMNNWNVDMPHTLSAPEDLIAQVRRACVAYNVPMAGENALEFNLADGSWAFDQMKKQLRGWSRGRDRMHGLTILRLKDEFVSEESLRELREFVVSFPA